VGEVSPATEERAAKAAAELDQAQAAFALCGSEVDAARRTIGRVARLDTVKVTDIAERENAERALPRLERLTADAAEAVKLAQAEVKAARADVMRERLADLKPSIAADESKLLTWARLALG